MSENVLVLSVCVCVCGRGGGVLVNLRGFQPLNQNIGQNLYTPPPPPGYGLPHFGTLDRCGGGGG